MKCSNCDTEYSDPNQTICEYCGSELTKEIKPQVLSPRSKLYQFLNDSRLKDLYQKIKKSLKE
jgi:DNA-directed RNA polymerase subunit RPC12/RpoP